MFELSNTKNLGAEGGKSLAGDVSKIIGQSASDATNAYYSATLNLAEEDDNQAEAKLSNVETYVHSRMWSVLWPLPIESCAALPRYWYLPMARFRPR